MPSDVESGQTGKHPQDFKNSYVKHPQKYGRLRKNVFLKPRKRLRSVPFFRPWVRIPMNKGRKYFLTLPMFPQLGVTEKCIVSAHIFNMHTSTQLSVSARVSENTPANYP